MAGIDRYEIERELGRGAMGVVHLARDTELDRQVALKEMIFPPGTPPDRLAEMVERFQREAKAAAALDSPGIVKIYDTASEGERHFIVMEYLDGLTLGQWLKAGSLPPDGAVGVAMQVLSALKVAHEAGIVHRDLKPENVFVMNDGLAKVADFGIARTQDSAGLTREGQVLGTLGYMSPEQVRGQEIDARSDIFALGVMLYEMLVGSNPFAADQPTTAMYRIAYEDPAPIDLVVADVPPHLGAVIKKATAKDPDLRYQSAQEMLTDLEAGTAPDVSAIDAAASARAVSQPQPTSPPPPAPAAFAAVRRWMPHINKKALAITLVGLLAVGGVAAGAVAYNRDKSAKDAQRSAAIRAEGEVMVDRVAELKGMRVELDKILKSVNNKADANTKALTAWDAEWQRRQDAYDVRLADVESHNTSENQKRANSAYTQYDYWYGTSYTYYTYTPRLWDYPDYPTQPVKVKIALSDEGAALIALEKRLTEFRAAIASDTASSQYFLVVYQRTDEAAAALVGAVSTARTMISGLVVAHPEKGDVVNASKLSMVDVSSLDTIIQRVDQEVSLYTSNYGMTIDELLATEGTGTPAATSTASP